MSVISDCQVRVVADGSFLTRFSPDELIVLSKLPRLYRNKRAYQYMQDIIGVNPDKISRANLNHLIKHQLSEAVIGLSVEEKLEKGNNLLTIKEHKLYDAILKTQWTLKHITFDYNIIKEKGNVLKSLQQRMRENNSPDNRHAFQETGKDDSVFFTLGSPRHRGAGFLQNQGGYVISLPVYSFIEGGKNKKIVSGLQFSDHWYQYVKEGFYSMMYGNTRRELRFFNDRGESYTLKGHKVYSYYRHDSTVLTRTLYLGQESVTGTDVLPFAAYNLILELRYIGGEYRQHLLDNSEQHGIVEVAIDSFYHSSNFEATIPSQVYLDSPNITVSPQIINPGKAILSARLMHEAISERKIDDIKDLLARGVSIDILDENGVMPLIKALSTYGFNVAYFLIDNGANLELKYQNYSAVTLSILAGRMDIVEKILSKNILFDARDSSIFRQIDINRDMNAISAGISRGYLSYFLSIGLNAEKFLPYIMFLLTENMLSEKIAIQSISLLLKPGFKFVYGKNKRDDHYFALTLLNAIHQQKLTLIEKLIVWGCKLNVSVLYSNHQWFDITPLKMAVISGNIDIVKLLHRSGAIIDKSDSNGQTALTLAVKMKYQDVVKFLLCQCRETKNLTVASYKKEIAKALVYRKSNKSGEIFFLVGQKRNKKNYELLSLDNSWSVWDECNLEELAIKAVAKGAVIDLLPHIAQGSIQKKVFDHHDFRKINMDLVIETYEYHVNDNLKLRAYPSDEYRKVRWVSGSDISNRHYLISNYDYPMILSVINNQSFTDHDYFHRLFNLNAQLFVAIERNSHRSVRKLLAKGADANSLNDKNLTPLSKACDKLHPNLKLIQILIRNGALLNYACCYEEITCDLPRPSLNHVQELIQNGGFSNDACLYEMAELVPVQLALLQKSKLLISLLCRNGANLNQKLGKSTTPLLTACGLGDTELIDELISYGADFKTDENKGILARLCAIPCNDSLFDYLLNHADINGSSAQQQFTPLMVCTRLGDLNRIKKLLAKGANPTILHPRTLKSAQDFALEKNVPEVINFFWENLPQKCPGYATDDYRVEGTGGFPTAQEENTEEEDHLGRLENEPKSFESLSNRSLFQPNIFKEFDNFEAAFKEFYDRNISHLALFKDQETDKIFNIDNEAVHILVEKFYYVTQHGGEEEKKVVKSFFLGRADKRDLSHLQDWYGCPVILPYHVPYVQFVMEQTYKNKEFILFSLSEILHFYHSPAVQFYCEDTIHTWLKMVEMEVPFSDLRIDMQVFTLTLMNNLFSDKTIVEKVFKQYIDTLYQLPVLSQEAATLVRLVLVLFKSSSSSLKKSLLEKLNWDQLRDMNIDCCLAIEDIIFLYRIHDATLKFPSVTFKKLLGNLCLGKINNVPLVNYKLSLLEQFLFTKNSCFPLPLVDSSFRNQVMDLWVETILLKYGRDDSTHVYYHTMKEIIDHIDLEVSICNKRSLLQLLTSRLETQFRLTSYIGDIFSSTGTKDEIHEENPFMSILDNVLNRIPETKVDQLKTLDFLVSPLTTESLDAVVEHTIRFHDCKDVEESINPIFGCANEGSCLNYRDHIQNSFLSFHNQFWDLNLEDRTCIIHHLLRTSNKSICINNAKKSWEDTFYFVVHKLFPNAQTDEHEKFLTAYLTAYLQTKDKYKSKNLLSSLITTLNEVDSEGKTLTPNQAITVLSKHLNQTYEELSQDIVSNPKTPKDVCQDLNLTKCLANPPNRWDLWHLVDQIVPQPEKENVERLGSLVGSMSNYLVLDCKLKSHNEQMVLLLQNNNTEDAKYGFIPLSKVSYVHDHAS